MNLLLLFIDLFESFNVIFFIMNLILNFDILIDWKIIIVF